MSVYDIVTKKILTQLQAGTIPWRKFWSTSKGCRNVVTRRDYSLLNQMLLLDHGPGYYGSFDQWQKLGGQVRKGEHGSMIVFWKLQEVETDEGKKVQKPVLRYYKVFHQSQIAGIEIEDPELTMYPTDPIETAEELLMGYILREGITYEETISAKAYYSVTDDRIHVPEKRQFPKSEMFYSTLAHEVAHSTGSTKRLNRRGLQDVSFGSESYSYEELIAEMTSAFLLNCIGIDTEATLTNSNAYIQGWLRVLKDDPKMIVKAAGQAERAANFIKGEA